MIRISLFPFLMLLAGWCFFDKAGLGSVALALAVIGIMNDSKEETDVSTK